MTRFLAGFVPFGEDLEDPTLVYKEILKRNDELKKNITANDKNEAI